MITGLYSSATSMDAAMKRHEVAAQNLANVNTTGYRKAVITQATFDSVLPPESISPDGVFKSKLLGTTVRPVQYDFTQGALDSTGRPLDVALSGDGFFTVQGPEGVLYTRNGSFHVSDAGQLVTADNMPVLGPYGPINVPDGATAESIRISLNGQLSFNGVEFGQLNVVSFPDQNVLSLAGPSLFSASLDATTQPSTALVEQGMLEISNTSSIDELISIVNSSRNLEASQKALNTIAESVQKRIGLR